MRADYKLILNFTHYFWLKNYVLAKCINTYMKISEVIQTIQPIKPVAPVASIKPATYKSTYRSTKGTANIN
jgi:hypothetical protein